MVDNDRIIVYLECGKRLTFAGALDWPGWSRSGRDEAAALQTLVDYGPRYSRVLSAAGIAFPAPGAVSDLTVLERLQGNATTDFGAPGLAPASDARPVDATELRRFEALLAACWQAFDGAERSAREKELRKGPRGGGRDLEAIVQHVLGADAGYLGQLGRKVKLEEGENADEALRRVPQATQEGLAAAVRGELPARGPRGGTRWSPRYFVRRVAWHVLDHAWEIEDRAV